MLKQVTRLDATALQKVKCCLWKVKILAASHDEGKRADARRAWDNLTFVKS
jgi:hypothetical protein